MKNSSLLVVLGLLVTMLMISGCPSTEVRETREHTVYGPNVQPTESTPGTHQPGPSPTPGPSPSPEHSSSAPSWVNETRQAQGQGAVDTTMHRTIGQAKLMAKRAAILDARRNLLETILGLRIDSSTSVRDFVTESDKIDAQSSGLIRASYVVGEAHYSADGICTVTVEVKLYDVWSYVKTQRTYTE